MDEMSSLAVKETKALLFDRKNGHLIWPQVRTRRMVILVDTGSNEIAIVDKETVENLIYIVRGQKVMLDTDLAKIYGYSTKAFNQQVKNNILKFGLRKRN